MSALNAMFNMTAEDFEILYKSHKDSGILRWTDLEINVVYRLIDFELMPSKFSRNNGSDKLSCVLHLQKPTGETNRVWCASILIDDMKNLAKEELESHVVLITSQGWASSKCGRMYHAGKFLKINTETLREYTACRPQSLSTPVELRSNGSMMNCPPAPKTSRVKTRIGVSLLFICSIYQRIGVYV